MLLAGIREFVISMIEKASLVSVRSEESHVTYRLPLHKPVYSLSQALQGAVPYPSVVVANIMWFQDTYVPQPLQNLIWSYYNLTPRRLLMPYNSTAMVVADREILTFDGTVLRAPRSRCKVLLTSIPGVARVSMSHPQPTSPPEIIFQAGHTHASISPDLSVKLNGQPVSSGEKTVSPVTVIVTPQHIMMESPLLGITLLKEARVLMVNVSGWVFNHTQGLLGSYDGEMANDWYTRQGRNASSVQELVRSWQEDASCSTPTSSQALQQIGFTITRPVECALAFETMWACHSVVDMKPFLEECRTGPSVCSALKPYRDTCVARHVRFLPPINC